MSGISDEDREEISALVLGFLTQGLKENPNGYSIREFERFFPERTDEPVDWYKRYKKRSTLEALECIQAERAIQLDFNRRTGETYVKLNRASDRVDDHLVDLVVGQRSSNKKRRTSRPSSRALTSFSLNRQYSSHHGRGHNHPFRLNHDQHYSGSASINNPSPLSNRSFVYNRQPSGSSRVLSNDPRVRGVSSSSSHMVPPQVRPPAAQPPPPPKPTTATPPRPPSRSSESVSSRPSVVNQSVPKLSTKRSNDLNQVKSSDRTDDPTLMQKKVYLRQRLQSLLTRKLAEIKLLHLSAIYELEFEEKIDPTAYGHRDMTSLLQDPELCSHIQLNFKAPFITISLRTRPTVNGKENSLSSRTSTATRSDNRGSSLSDKSNLISSTRSKLEAADPFNIKSMLYSLEPLPPTKEPTLKNREVEDEIKYKTMHLIFMSRDAPLKLDEWESRFEEENRLKIKIWDYGFKTNLEFFKYLANEAKLPIKIHLKGDDWVAIADLQAVSGWLNEQLNQHHWKAVTAVDKRYELLATPSDTYTYNDSSSLIGQEFDRSVILSTKPPNSMWLRIRNTSALDAHLNIESSMTSYEDYKRMNIFDVPKYYVRPGLPCAAFDNVQQLWCRALILKAPSTIDKNYEITALLVDYGVERKFAITELACLMKTHLHTPVGPIYSRLFGVKGEGLVHVQRRSKMILQGYTNPPVSLACKILSKIESGLPSYLPSYKFEVTLLDNFDGKTYRNLADHINSTGNCEETT